MFYEIMHQMFSIVYQSNRPEDELRTITQRKHQRFAPVWFRTSILQLHFPRPFKTCHASFTRNRDLPDLLATVN